MVVLRGISVNILVNVSANAQWVVTSLFPSKFVAARIKPPHKQMTELYLWNIAF
jgi:hypothetical protein